MAPFLDELAAGWLTADEFARVMVRLLAAMLVGGVVGLDRELSGKAAGMRTHMLVAMGCALFALTADLAGMGHEATSRVLQGVAAGIGFIGGGAILKSTDKRQIYGLTTAASLWMAAAAGLTAGLGHLGLALVASALAWVVLGVLTRIERRLGTEDSERA
jgi:putative Mg2+ transporter-C (MgtC) family protein